jgi:hypothetical protein
MKSLKDVSLFEHLLNLKKIYERIEMKLIVKTDKEIKNLTSRDIRNFTGAIVDKEYIDDVMWHKKTPPKLIYIKPFKLGFEIVTWTNDIGLLQHIAEKLKDKTINIKNINAKIKKTWFKDENFTIPQKGLYFYETRTPIILSVNPVEYKIVYATNTKEDKSDLIKYIKRRIITDIKYKAKHYYNLNLNLDDLNLIIEDENVRLVEYKEDLKKFQAVFLRFASNYSLPRFIGYKTGLGWGEIISKRI